MQRARDIVSPTAKLNSRCGPTEWMCRAYSGSENSAAPMTTKRTASASRLK